MATAKFTVPETIATIMSTELNSLADNAGAVSAAQTTDRLFYADLELVVTFGSAPVAGSLIEVYIARQIDGTNYETYTTGASGVGPLAGYLGGFPLYAVTSAQRIILPQITLAPLDYRLFFLNKSGQAFPSSGSTIKIRRYTEEAV